MFVESSLLAAGMAAEEWEKETQAGLASMGLNFNTGQTASRETSLLFSPYSGNDCEANHGSDATWLTRNCVRTM